MTMVSGNDNQTHPADHGAGAVEDVVLVQRVSKRYGRQVALRALDLEIADNTVTAFLGRNGAGKTTLLEILTGLRRPDSGSVRVLGLDPYADRVPLARKVGIQVQEFALQSTVRVGEALEFFARLYPDPIPVPILLDRFGLRGKEDVRFPRLSGGQRRRLGIARALIGNPRIVLLDEPTSGLDLQGKEFLRREIRRLRAEGRTVLLSTHEVDDAQDLADDVAVVDDGRLVAHGSPRDIVHTWVGTTRFRVEGGIEPFCTGPTIRAVVPGVGEHLVFTDRPEPVRAALAAAVSDGRARVEERAATLSDAFLLATGTEVTS